MPIASEPMFVETNAEHRRCLWSVMIAAGTHGVGVNRRGSTWRS